MRLLFLLGTTFPRECVREISAMPIYKQAIIPQPHAAAVSPRENIDRTHVTRKQIRTHDGQQGNDPFDPLD